MLMFCAITRLSAQTAPPFRANPQIQVPDANSGPAETSPAGIERRELFTAVPGFLPQSPRMPGLPRTGATTPGIVRNAAGSQAPLVIRDSPAGVSRRGALARASETPTFLQRHPDRNLTQLDVNRAFTFRAPNDSKTMARLSIGLQEDTWHNDNLTFSKRKGAIGEVVMEWRPILQLDIGSPPAGRTWDPLGTEYFLTLRYTPTFHALLDAGTSRFLQRVTGEIGRASPALVSLVRFEYDENIFGARGNNTIEESSTVTEIAPLIEYSLSAKTVLRAEGTWRRIAPQDSSTQRSEYIFETGIACDATPKTTVGAGLEFGHIIFDRARFGVQNYEQAYGSMEWHASAKVRVQARAGVELRQFENAAPKPARVSPVATAIVNWQASERTQVNTGFVVRNQPSVSLRGATFQEIRFGTDARQQIAENFYIRGEAAIIRRAYDTGIHEIETVLRPAFGFHSSTGRLFDSLNVEIYYQYRRLESNQPTTDPARDRNMIGIESTLYF